MYTLKRILHTQLYSLLTHPECHVDVRITHSIIVTIDHGTFCPAGVLAWLIPTTYCGTRIGPCRIHNIGMIVDTCGLSVIVCSTLWRPCCSASYNICRRVRPMTASRRCPGQHLPVSAVGRNVARLAPGHQQNPFQNVYWLISIRPTHYMLSVSGSAWLWALAVMLLLCNRH